MGLLSNWVRDSTELKNLLSQYNWSPFIYLQIYIPNKPWKQPKQYLSTINNESNEIGGPKLNASGDMPYINLSTHIWQKAFNCRQNACNRTNAGTGTWMVDWHQLNVRFTWRTFTRHPLLHPHPPPHLHHLPLHPQCVHWMPQLLVSWQLLACSWP